MKLIYEKLVRDNIPEIIEADNKKVKYRILEDEEYIARLNNKLKEEAEELARSTSKRDIINELSDLLEVIEALEKIHDITRDELEVHKEKKARRNGKFDKKVLLEYVEEIL